jgi:broad specificity phosphatase PhoE
MTAILAARPRLPDVWTARGPVAHDVLLVRHAPTSWTGIRWCGRADPPLTPGGRAVARALGIDLVRELAVVPTILASPARRTRATAAAIAAAGGWSVEVDESLLEVDVGAAEGLTWQELEVRLPDVAARLAAGESVDWPGGEAALDVDRRAARVSKRVVEVAAASTVIVVGHGGILHALVRAILGDGPASGLTSEPAPRLEPAGIARIVPADPR